MKRDVWENGVLVSTEHRAEIVTAWPALRFYSLWEEDNVAQPRPGGSCKHRVEGTGHLTVSFSRDRCLSRECTEGRRTAHRLITGERCTFHLRSAFDETP